MQFLLDLASMFLHLDQALAQVVADYGRSTYLILAVVVFCETGLVVTPFLPGDSLLFAAGAMAGAGHLNPELVVALLSGAAILGDSANFAIGRRVGPAIFEREKLRFINKKHLEEAHSFYQRHGGKTIVLARFIPIIRTFAPFVAGIARMDYRRFLAFNVSGGLLWVAGLTYLGYFFGNLPLVKNNFSLFIALIVVVSVLPVALEVGKKLLASRGGRA
jgi:membrane-associated protein